jgi:DNA-binding HxlR family transcriptional regulator
MALLGERWITVIVAAAFLRTRRFVEFERTLGVPPTLLTQRLRTLVQLGVLRRAPSGARPGVHEYRLTEKGLAFFPVMVLVARWANRWMPTPAGPPVRISHPACGAVLEPVLACDACGEALQRVELHVAAPGPVPRLKRPDGVSSA